MSCDPELCYWARELGLRLVLVLTLLLGGTKLVLVLMLLLGGFRLVLVLMLLAGLSLLLLLRLLLSGGQIGPAAVTRQTWT